MNDTQAQKIAIVGNKGGTGKTFIAVHIAYAVCDLKKEVLLIDTDYGQYSALNWILGRGKKYKPGEIYSWGVYLHCVGVKEDEIKEQIKEYEKKYKYIVIDGRPEPRITGDILEAVEGHRIIIPIAVEAEAIKQARELWEMIEKYKVNVKKYAIINKLTQARVSQTLFNEIEKMDFIVLSVFSRNDRVLIAERECVPIWQVRFSGLIKHGEMLREIGRWFVMGWL